MTDFVTRTLILNQMRDNNTFGDAVRAAHTDDMQGLAFILRIATLNLGSTPKVTLRLVCDITEFLVASFEELCAELDAAAAATTEEKAVMLDAIEAISSDLGLVFKCQFNAEQAQWIASAASHDELEWYEGVDESFQGAVQKLLEVLNETFFE